MPTASRWPHDAADPAPAHVPPVLPPQVLEQMGVSIAIHPAFGFLAAAQALQGACGHPRSERSALNAPVLLHDFMAFGRRMGFEAVWEFDRRHARG